MNPLPDYFGPPFPRPFASILNSRQNKMPRGFEPWVEMTLDAAKHIAKSGLTALTSLGTHPWNLAVWAISEFGGAQIIVLPKFADEHSEKIVDNTILNFSLNPEKTAFILYPTQVSASLPKHAWLERDRIIFETSNAFFPVSLRPKGNMESNLENALNLGKAVDSRFGCNYAPAKPLRMPQIELSSLGNQLAPESWDYLTHWTRSFATPWPDETLADFYRGIVNSEGDYARSALASLRRIISDQRVFAGDEHARRGERFASFTELPPAEAIKLMKWNPRQMRYTFEPYGIAIRRNAAEKFGIKKVVYGTEYDYQHISDSEKPFFQISGKGNWNREAEWRFLGDVTLADFSRDDLLLIVVKKEDENQLPKGHGIRVISLQNRVR